MQNDDFATINADDIEWQEFTSERGKTYQVGYLKTGETPPDSGPEPTLMKKDFGIGVVWNVEGSSWINTSPQVRDKAAIKRYALGDDSNSIYRYILYFENTEHYSYYFSDETGDRYNVNTYRNGTHTLRFNSDAPSILFISGS